MTIEHSSIHSALGESVPLDYALIERAVAGRVVEDEQLDWKQRLSDGDELAKDVAAMANSRGGLIVYGVTEDRSTGQASAAMPVDVSDKVVRQIRSWISQRIRPAIAGVEILPQVSGRSTEGFLVIRVPESSDAPHLIGDEKLGAPYRVGTQTFWMREWDLERAYQDRFTRRASEETRLVGLIDQVTDHLDMESGCWIVGAGLPTVGVPRTSEPPDKTATVSTLQSALQLGVEIKPPDNSRSEVIRALGDAALNPRVGLRRWIAQTRRDTGPAELSDMVHLEIHHDGGAVIGTRVDGWHRAGIDGKHCVPYFAVNGFAADFIAVLETIARSRGNAGQTVFRVELRRSNDDPFAILTPETRGGWIVQGLHQPGWSRDVRRFIPIEGVAPRTEDLAQLRELARGIAVDIASEFGLPESGLQW